ncbi:MAG: cytochrome c3 family protein [Eubacteriales bacterium]
MQDRRKTILAICGILLFLVFFAVAFSSVTAKDSKSSSKQGNSQDDNKSCTGCHEMNPEVATWQVSSHSKIPCTACHQVKPSDFQAQHDSQSFTKPIKMTDAIPSNVCEQCHSPNRVATTSGDLIIPHDRHAAAGVACVKCHAGVVHGKIAERGSAADGKYESWDQDFAKKQATMYYREPSMWTCIGCHRQLKVTRRCGACHTEIPSLPSHDNPTWKSDHGKSARADIGGCTKCHVTPGSPTFVTPSTGDKAADFARAQEFCYSCHLQRPAMHENSMIPVHPSKVAQRGIQNCLTCHNPDPPKPEAKVTGTYCNQCHWLPTTQQSKAGAAPAGAQNETAQKQGSL